LLLLFCCYFSLIRSFIHVTNYACFPSALHYSLAFFFYYYFVVFCFVFAIVLMVHSIFDWIALTHFPTIHNLNNCENTPMFTKVICNSPQNQMRAHKMPIRIINPTIVLHTTTRCQHKRMTQRAMTIWRCHFRTYRHTKAA
jgi:hypothetical protein